jgi:hypothetical protein
MGSSLPDVLFCPMSDINGMQKLMEKVPAAVEGSSIPVVELTSHPAKLKTPVLSLDVHSDASVI